MAEMRRGTDALTRLAVAHDASRFLQVPSEVVVASSADDMAALFQEARASRTHVTLRGAGTSLSGQAVTDGILCDVRREFQHVEVLDDGARVRAGAGATIAQVNALLRPYGRRLGPDPASAVAATIGGMVANNSTGKTSGISGDVFHTIDSCVVVLPNGRVLDTANVHADLILNFDEAALSSGLITLRRRLREDPRTMRNVSRLWSMRNSMGYHLRALTDFARPSDIVRQLMVGSEGTLGFVAEATLRTVPLRPHRYLEVALFESLEAAIEAGAMLTEYGFDVVELFDEDAIRLIQELPDSHQTLLDVEVERHAALLLELHCNSTERLAERIAHSREVLDRLPSHKQIHPDDQHPAQWRIHHGLVTAMAAGREPGTSVLIEDFSVPHHQIQAAIAGLNALFDKFGYPRSAITGHLTDGTFHFVLTENFEDPKTVRRFKRFVAAFADLIISLGGVMRAQHGTGRAMAPFLEKQVGVELFEVMRAIKHLFDPDSVLAPRTMFSEDPDIHVTHLKLNPQVEPSVTQCIECGLCEPGCPSSALTLSPRGRIALRREIEVRAGDRELIDSLREQYRHAAIDTCSTSGACQIACPLNIDVGDLVRAQRTEMVSPREEMLWQKAAERYDAATRLSSIAMSAADRLKPLAHSITKFGRERFGDDLIWRYSDDLPRGSRVRRRPGKARTAKEPVAAYFPGCQQTMMASHGQGIFAAFNALCVAAGVQVSLLDASNLCCGIPWKSRGLERPLQTMTDKVRRSLEGLDRVVIDASACAEGLREMLEGTSTEVVDVVDFVADALLPHLQIERRLASLYVHPTCATLQTCDDTGLMRIAHAIADDVVTPAAWRCCGGHGDSGLRHPDVPRTAAASFAELEQRTFDAYVSSTRSCEVALSQATSHPFRHIVEVLAECCQRA